MGLSESEAQRQGVKVRVAKLPMGNVLRTDATDETQGFMKVLVSESDDRILGFTMDQNPEEQSAAGRVAPAACLAPLPASPDTLF